MAHTGTAVDIRQSGCWSDSNAVQRIVSNVVDTVEREEGVTNTDTGSKVGFFFGLKSQKNKWDK